MTARAAAGGGGGEERAASVDDEDKDMAKTMARLDRELDQAGKIIHRIEGFAGPKSPFHSLCERLKAGRPAPRPTSRWWPVSRRWRTSGDRAG